MARLLIVNADDLGHDAASTRAAAACFAERRISSASAMVYMRDSENAAAFSREAKLPLGLHLNLSEEYTAADVPDAVRKRHARVTTRFRGGLRRLRRWLYDPTIQSQVDRCIEDQLEAFRKLYGRAPTHIDGHQHVQVSPNVLLSRVLEPGTCMRNALCLDRRTPLAPARRARSCLLRARFVSTQYCFDFSDWRRALAVGQRATVEVIVHPALGDLDELLSDEWGQALSGNRLGSFASLAGAQR